MQRIKELLDEDRQYLSVVIPDSSNVELILPFYEDSQYGEARDGPFKFLFYCQRPDVMYQTVPAFEGRFTSDDLRDTLISINRIYLNERPSAFIKPFLYLLSATFILSMILLIYDLAAHNDSKFMGILMAFVGLLMGAATFIYYHQSKKAFEAIVRVTEEINEKWTSKGLEISFHDNGLSGELSNKTRKHLWYLSVKVNDITSEYYLNNAPQPRSESESSSSSEPSDLESQSLITHIRGTEISASYYSS